MNYDTYGSSAVELAIELANAERNEPQWADAFLGSHDEWFAPGTSLELTAAETRKAEETAELVRAVAVAESQSDVPGANHSPWEPRNASAHCGSSRSALASSMASSTADDP